MIIYLIGNLLPSQLLWFYQEQVCPDLTAICITWSYFAIISLARILQYVSPATFQNLNKSTLVNRSLFFVFASLVLDILINDVRCLVQYTEAYEAEGIHLIVIEMGFKRNPMFTSFAKNTTQTEQDEARCFDYLF